MNSDSKVPRSLYWIGSGWAILSLVVIYYGLNIKIPVVYILFIVLSLIMFGYWFKHENSQTNVKPAKILIKKEDENTILFEDKDESGVIKATIGFQIVEGQLTIYMKGYKIDSIKFPKLEGFYGYLLTDEELDTVKDFLQKMGRAGAKGVEK